MGLTEAGKVFCLVFETQRLPPRLLSHQCFSPGCFSLFLPVLLTMFVFLTLSFLSLFVSPSLYLSVPLLSPSSIRSGWGLRAMTGVMWAVCGSPSRPQTPRTQLQQVRAVADSMCLCAFCGGSPTPTQGTSPFNSGARKGGDLMVWDRQ